MNITAATTLAEHIEADREAGLITNDQAQAATIALSLTENEAMLACRLLGGGADPASLQYLEKGEVDDLVALAHHAGPGIYLEGNNPERETYLALCALSADESKSSTLRERVLHYGDTLHVMGSDREQMFELAALEYEKIMALPYETKVVDGITLRIYRSDRGFANAYWSGCNYAAVYFEGGDPYLYVCTNGTRSVESLGIKLNKTLDANRGLILDHRVAEIMG